MSNDKLLAEVLQQVLTSETIKDLNQLAKRMNSNKGAEAYQDLRKTLSESKVLRAVFTFAASKQEISLTDFTDNYLNSDEVMHLLGISKRTLIKWRRTGILPFIRNRNNCYHRLADLNKLLMSAYSVSDSKSDG